METVLGKLNAIPGVIGTMLCDTQGKLLAHAFPAAFDEQVLQQAAAALADGAVGLETATGPIATIDLRFDGARILGKPIAGALLLLLCSQTINMQLAMMSVSVVSRRLDQIIAAGETMSVPTRPLVAASAEPAPVNRNVQPAPRRPDPRPQKKGLSWWPSV